MRIALVLALVALAAAWAQPSPTIAPEYVINLDLDPSERWTQVIEDYKNDFGPILDYFNKLIPPAVQKLLDPIVGDLDSYLPSPYADELRGIAAAAAPALNLGQLVTVNIIYDLTAFCTSVVAETVNGTIFHARNLDYDIPGLRQLTIQVDFQSNNQTVYRGTTWAGYVGLLTGMKPGMFGYTVDERDTPNGSVLDNIFALLAHKGQSIGFTLRTSLATHTSYDEAIDFVSNVPLMAPVYIIVSGAVTTHGAVMTRDREFALDVWSLNSDFDQQGEEVASDVWYRVETNYDRWRPDPVDDRRRIPTEQALTKLGQANLSLDAMFTILSSPPMLNAQTVYTTLMSPTTGSLTTYIRWDAPNATVASLPPHRLPLHRLASLLASE